MRVVEELKRVRARITDAAGFKCGFNPMHDQEQGAGTRFDKRGLALTPFRLQRVGDRGEQRLAAACCSGLAGDGRNGNSRHHAKSRGQSGPRTIQQKQRPVVALKAQAQTKYSTTCCAQAWCY